MKTSVIAGMFVALFGLLTGGNWSLQNDAIWDGPRSSVEWVGLIAPHQPQANLRALKSPEVTLEETAPELVGYFKRGSDWRVRLIPYGMQDAETLRRYSTTSDGWLITDIVVRGNRVKSVAVEKEDTQVILEIKQ